MSENYFNKFCDKNNKMTLNELKNFCQFYFKQLDLHFGQDYEDNNISFLFNLFSHHDQININQFNELVETINIMKKLKEEIALKTQSPKKKERSINDRN